MPQFDFHSFSVQVFWSLVGFFFFYFTILKEYISNLALLFKLRSKILISFISNILEAKKISFFNFFLE